MKKISIGAGTPFYITIPLPENISEYSNVLLALYTDENKPVKFSYVEKTGYNKLESSQSGNQLTGILTREQTAKMRGCLLMEMEFVKVGEPEDGGNSIPYQVLGPNGEFIEIVKNVLSKSL